MMAEEELEAVFAIFSRAGEVHVDPPSTDGSRQCTVHIKPYEGLSTSDRAFCLRVVIDLPAQYPFVPLTFSIFCDQLSRNELGIVRMKTEGQLYWLEDRNRCKTGLLPLLTALQDEFSNLLTGKLAAASTSQAGSISESSLMDDTHRVGSGAHASSSSVTCPDEGVWTSLVKIEHMRTRTKYTKTLVNWATELGLTGRLLFQGKLIYNLLQGNRQKLKDYLVRQRTVNIDVDSKGHKCKEKLSRVLCEERLPDHIPRFNDFQVVECESLRELEDFFHQVNLQDIFVKYLSHLR